MGKGRIRLLSTIPGPTNLGPIVREFCKKGGVITALSDPAVRTLAGLVPGDSTVEAIPFGSLARRFASICGELPSPVAHAGHVAAAIGVACLEVSSESPFYATAHRLGLHRAIQQTLHELSDYGLEPDEYDVLAASAEPALRSKLASLATIERRSTDTLRQLGRSFSREHFRVCQLGSPEKGADLGRVLVLAGSEFSPQAVQLLRWAAIHGARITVIIYRHPSVPGLFQGAYRTAGVLGTEPEDVGKSNQLLDHLFGQSQASRPDVRCTVVSAADPLAEVEWAIRGCLDRHQSGTAYERMAIYVRDSDSYAPLIEASAKRLGVPVRMWRRAPLLTNSFARATLAALEFCASRDVRSLTPLARTSYVRLDYEGRKSLQEALKTAHSSRGEQWKSLREWVESQQDKFGWLSILLDWRDDAISSPAILEIWIGKLRELMLVLPQDEGAVGGRERDKRALFVLQQSLNQIASVQRLFGPRSMNLSEFAQRARQVWSDADVSVPAGESGVLVTSQSESLPESKCLFVLGMLEGVFPRRRTEDPILSDFDREAISKLRGGQTLPTSRDRAEAERDEFYSVCAAATDEIILSYPETDEERDNVPAFYLDEVARALGSVSMQPRSREILTPALAECNAESDRRIREALDSPQRVDAVSLQFSNPFTSKSFSRDPEQGFRPRELREALQCPFSFFARRTLDLRPERLRARWFSLVSLPQRAGLASSASPEEALHALEKSLESELDDLYSEVANWEIALLRSGGKRLIREWIDREFAARRIWPKEDLRLDVHFGEEGLRSNLPKIVKLNGHVAAISRCGPYSVVHLVETSGPAKTYGPAFDLTDQDRLYYGVHLLAAWDKNSPSALEIETMAGERYLMLLPRVAGVDLPARVQEGLKVIDLAGAQETGGTRVFFDEVKKLALEAAKRIGSVDVRALKGDHCSWCDYGELCRQSMEYGEEDSPFVEDL